MHYFVNKARGKASNYACIDCGKQARDWSRIHETDDERDPNTFEPRCRKCHMKYDDHKRNQRGNPLPARTQEAARIANLGNKHNVGRKRPDLAARNKGNHFAKPCAINCRCRKHRRKSTEE